MSLGVDYSIRTLHFNFRLPHNDFHQDKAVTVVKILLSVLIFTHQLQYRSIRVAHGKKQQTP